MILVLEPFRNPQRLLFCFFFVLSGASRSAAGDPQFMPRKPLPMISVLVVMIRNAPGSS